MTDIAALRGTADALVTELQQLRASVTERAADGRLELYKTSMMHDGPIGREQHGFPSQQELAL